MYISVTVNIHSHVFTCIITGKMTVLMDTAWDISCCAVVKQWNFWAKASGVLKIGVFRPNGTNYYAVGYNEIIIPGEERM